MYKILQMPIHDTGGVTSYVLRNWEFIDKNKFEFDFATFSKTPLAFEQKLKDKGCKVHYISCYAKDDYERYIYELNKIFDEGYDAVHLHTGSWQNFLMEEVAVQRNVPVIIIHARAGNVDIYDDTERKAAISVHERLKSLFKPELATHFAACSKVAAGWLFGDQIPRDKIMILNNAIDIKRFSYKPNIREKYRKLLGLEESFVIGHIGRFSYAKNHDMLISIFKKVCDDILNAKLLLIGAESNIAATGGLKAEIEQKVAELGLTDKVLFLGARNEIPELLQVMDTFVLPSRFEGLPNVLIEAQCAGLKCFTSEFVTTETKITSNLEFLPYDISVWADKIVEMTKSDFQRQDMSQEVTYAGYSIEEQVKVLEKIYSHGAGTI